MSRDCILWTGATDREGYGRTTRNKLAHRAAWEQVNGPIPDGMKVLHRCDQPPCINVEHLFLGTQTDNVNDMNAKGRHGYTGQPGERHHAAKLREGDVLAIYASRERGVDLAQRYGVSETTICGIRKGRTWQWLTSFPSTTSKI